MSSDADTRKMYGQVAFGAWLGIAGNLTLGAAKLAGGILGASEALIADSVDTLSDSISSVVVLLGAWRAQRPADPEHPYGHGKAEVLAGRSVAVIVMIVGVLFGYRAVVKVLSPEPQPAPALWTLWLALASIIVKEAMSRYKMYVGRKIKSESLIADAMNHRSDVFTSMFAAAGITAAVYLGPEWRFLDPIAAAVICLIIFGIGVAAFRRTSSALMDQAADAETVEAIRRVAATVEGVEDTEKLLTRRSGLETHVDLHVEVDPQMPVGQAHDIATKVAEAVRRQVPGVAHVTVHIEPYFPGDH
ncbi:MAG TPA: cation diffusion facilitator family transporter [Phycisphaerae bacterium]|nr:cation diffusion facilitator family transporter [Phycisphaerae bacterium]